MVQYWKYRFFCWLLRSKPLMFNAYDSAIRELGEAMLVDGASVGEINRAMLEAWREKHLRPQPFLNDWHPLNEVAE